MSTLSTEQKTFLQKHKIDERMIFDATWIRHKDYGKIMKNLWLFFAIWVTPCKKNWHTLRSRKGKCIQCSPADIAFIERSWKNAYIYVVWSIKWKVLKVGFSKDIDDRLKHLNWDKYWWINDWKIIYKWKYNDALKFETLIHNKLSDVHYNIEYNYFWHKIICNEIFRCNFTKIKKIIDLNKEKFWNVEDEYTYTWKIEKYDFVDESKKIKNYNIKKEDIKLKEYAKIINDIEETEELQKKLEEAEQKALAYGNGLDIISEHPVLWPMSDKLLKWKYFDIKKHIKKIKWKSKLYLFLINIGEKIKKYFIPILVLILIFLYGTGFFQNEADPIKVFKNCNLTEYVPKECELFCSKFKKGEKLIFWKRSIKIDLLLPSRDELLNDLKVPAWNCVQSIIDKFNNSPLEDQINIEKTIRKEANFKGLFEFKFLN